MPTESASSPSKPGDGIHHRLVAVQGSAQLASALAAIRAADRARPTRVTQNHLIVHDLSTPDEQVQGFVNALQVLSAQAESWSSVRYVSQADLIEFDRRRMHGGWSVACLGLRESIGIPCCDELLLGQNLLFMNKLLRMSYPRASAACYGDGIGLNFSHDYYNPKSLQRGLRGSVRRLKTKWKSLLRRFSAMPLNLPHLTENAVHFDQYYLLVANGFDQHLAHFEQLDAADFIDVFALFSITLSKYSKDLCDELDGAIRQADQVVFLLTSNFSESKRMTLESELHCCIEQVTQQQRSDNALLIIKPHPRDSEAKIAALKTEALKHFKSVIAFTDPWTFFIPFEAIFARFIASDTNNSAKTSVVCSSSACVSLELLYGQRCQLGFGADNVVKHFSDAWRELRCQHEADLHRLLLNIRSASEPKDVNAARRVYAYRPGS